MGHTGAIGERLEFRLLGPLEVRGGSGPIAVGGLRSRSVLAALLLEAGRVVPIEQIVDAAWGEQPPASARVQAQNKVSTLRRILCDAQPDFHIGTSGSGYLLKIADDQLDVALFARAVERAAAMTDPEQESRVLAGALELWRGPALADLNTPALQAAAQRLEEQRLHALERRLRLDLELGRHGRLVGELGGLVSAHPFHERFAALLMVALYRSGRKAEALDAYHRTRDVLGQQLGLDPGELLQRLHTAMLRGEPVVGLEEEQAPPPVAPSTAPRELPAAVAGFTGRAEELKLLAAQHDPAVMAGLAGLAVTTITVITGSAGVGKTALAVHWAHRVAHLFPDGQLYLDLRGYGPSGAVPPIAALAQFLRSLGVPAQRVPTDESEAAALFRSTVAGRKLLVLLDNARSAEQVRPLLPGGPGILVVVTSRDRLAGLVAREGARRVTLEVLRPRESLALLAQLLGGGRVAAEPGAAAELAALCAHLPLALRVSAANLASRPHRTLTEHAAAMGNGNRLATLAADGDERAAVRAAFDLSYLAMPDPARRQFRLLGLVPGPDVTAGAAAALAGGTPAEAERLLDRLAAEHLVHEHAPGRYMMHDLLRAYAGERAVKDPESGAALRRLLDWYLTAADTADRTIYPERARPPLPPVATSPVTPRFDEAAAASAWFDGERPNLVAAIQHASQHGPPAAAWQIAEAMAGYVYLGRHMVDWRLVMGAGLVAAERDGSLTGQALTNLSLAILHRINGEHATSIAHAERALPMARESGWRKGEAIAHSVLSSVRWQSGELLAAVELLTECLNIYRSIGEIAGQAINLNNLGVLYCELGELSRAVDCAEQALALITPDDRVTTANLRGALGHYLHLMGRFGEAEGHLRAALAITQEVNDRGNSADILTYLAEVCLDTGRDELALRHALEAVGIFDEIGYTLGQTTGANTLGAVFLRTGRHLDAIAQHERALSIATEHDLRHPRTMALIGLARAHAALGRRELAARLAADARELAARAGYKLLVAQAESAYSQASPVMRS